MGLVWIARRSGVSQAQVSRVFAHKRAVSVDHVLAIAHALGLRGSD
ncbi:MAG: helix-turn-helix domain-containing protein, partial [Pauljensenia sp.]